MTSRWRSFRNVPRAPVEAATTAQDPGILDGDERWRLPALTRFGAELREAEVADADYASRLRGYPDAPVVGRRGGR